LHVSVQELHGHGHPWLTTCVRTRAHKERDTDVNATDTSWHCSSSYTAMLRGPLHSEVELTLASTRNNCVYTIRVLRHRYHEFDSVESKSSPLAKGSGGKLSTSFPQQAAPARNSGKGERERERERERAVRQNREREMEREREMKKEREREREREMEKERERAVRQHKDAITMSAERALSYASGTRYRMRHHPTALPASCTYVCMYVCIYIYVHTRAHSHTHKHTHTHTHTNTKYYIYIVMPSLRCHLPSSHIGLCASACGYPPVSGCLYPCSR